MQKLNLRYRRKRSATDVLSFSAGEPFWSGGFLGEILICEQVLRRQARERGIEPEMELLILVIHGLLHLLGWDHERSEREAREMEKWERWLLAKVS